MVNDLVPGPGQSLSQPAHVLPGHVGCDGLFDVGVEFGMQPVVLDHIATVSIQQGEQPPECERQATRFVGDEHDPPSAVNVAGSVEIVGERNLLTTSITQRQGCLPPPGFRPDRNIACNYSEFDKDASGTLSSVSARPPRNGVVQGVWSPIQPGMAAAIEPA